MSGTTEHERRNVIAQWVFDTRPILGRFHLWLEDVEENWELNEDPESGSFAGPSLTRAFLMAAAVTALGTRLFGRHGAGKGLDRAGINQAKKHADAVSAYALSESLWYLTRSLPENHAVMVCLGEGLMPKAGEGADLGSNPLLGFGRVYGRPQVAKFLDRRVHRLINDETYDWEDFWRELQEARITVWGAAIDALENTSRFAKGSSHGPMTLLHLYNQPLVVSTPYEGYFGNLVLPREVADHAAKRSVLLGFHTPRQVVLREILDLHPEVAPERVYVWTLRGKSREKRLGALWDEWRALDVQLVEDGWKMPGGSEIFTDSGTYAPVSRVGLFDNEAGQRCMFLCDGYSASAEAIQAASLDPVYDNRTSISLFSSTFKLPVERERDVMRLDAESADFAEDLAGLAGEELPREISESYRESIRDASAAGLPMGRLELSVDDFFPRKQWRLLAVQGHMLPDPYSGAPGVEEVGEGIYRVSVGAATHNRRGEVTLTLRLGETLEESRLVFSPLLDRFYAGEDYTQRPVKVSDSGRIRNELQTLCSDALEYLAEDVIRISFERISPAMMSDEKKEFIRQVLHWYQQNHPLWFRWLQVAD